MKNKTVTVLVILFILSIVACNRLMQYSEVRTVEFISIFVCGVFGGLLIAFFIRKKDLAKN